MVWVEMVKTNICEKDSFACFEFSVEIATGLVSYWREK